MLKRMYLGKNKSYILCNILLLCICFSLITFAQGIIKRIWFDLLDKLHYILNVPPFEF